MKKLFKWIILSLLLFSLGQYHLLAAKKKTIKMNFNDVEVLHFIKIIGKETGKTFVFKNGVLKGKRITLLSNQNFSSSDAYTIFNAVLNINGLSVIEEGKISRIVSSKEAKITPTQLYTEKIINSGSYITRVIPVKNVKSRTIRSSLIPLISKNAILVGNDDANILILRDTKENTERFANIVEIIDRADNEISKINLEIIPLKFANSTEIASLLSKIFSSKNKKTVQSSASFKALPDKRTNSVILIGAPKSLSKIKRLISELDNKIETHKGKGNTRVYPLNNANADKIAKVLQKIAATLKNTKKQKTGAIQTTIIPDIPSNSLVIYADQADFPTLENVIKKLDIERAQVFIQVLIMEVRLDKSLEQGVEWQVSDISQVEGQDVVTTVGGVGSTGKPRTTSDIASSSTTGAVVGLIGGPITFGGVSYSSFNVFIKAMEQDTEIDILSKPQILTLNNEESEIKVGEIIPTVGSTSVDSNGKETVSINYKEVGISMKITPQINLNGTIELKIDETSSNVIEGTVGAYDQGAITTLNRSIKTKVVVHDGETVALGGLISDQTTTVETKTPCLGDIPILGWFFKSASSSTQKTNLLIFLTPNIVRNQKDLNKVTSSAKKELKSSRKGRFRIDVSKEFNIPVDELSKQKESDNDAKPKTEDNTSMNKQSEPPK